MMHYEVDTFYNTVTEMYFLKYFMRYHLINRLRNSKIRDWLNTFNMLRENWKSNLQDS